MRVRPSGLPQKVGPSKMPASIGSKAAKRTDSHVPVPGRTQDLRLNQIAPSEGASAEGNYVALGGWMGATASARIREAEDFSL